MPSRSWMAALALALGTAATISTLAPRAARADDATVTNRVALELQINGLAAGQSIIEIKPGHPGCRFAPVKRAIQTSFGGGMVRLEPIVLDATSLGADRDCSFAITIHEPGQPPKTFRRGLRLDTPATPGATTAQSLKLYLSAPSVATREGANPTAR